MMAPSFPVRPRGWCFLELNLSYLKQHVLPQLVERSFGEAEVSNYQVAILAGNPPAVIFSSEPSLPASSFTPPDGRAVLFASFGELGALMRARTWRRFSQGGVRPGPIGPSTSRSPWNTPETGPPEDLVEHRLTDGNAWVLVVKNKSGSM